MMRMIITALVLLSLATPSLAARVYLKDGGRIDAKSVWRSSGRVHVLINRDTLTTYASSEIDMKRTFPKRHHAVRRHPHGVASHHVTAVAAPAPASAQRKAPGKGLSFPKLPEMSPPSRGGKEEGTIRKQKKEMQERLNE